jgi:hypothetical protein
MVSSFRVDEGNTWEGSDGYVPPSCAWWGTVAGGKPVMVKYARVTLLEDPQLEIQINWDIEWEDWHGK